MKTLEFETSKGRFVVKDLNFIPLDCNGIKLSEITEEQARGIVDSLISGTVLGKLFTGLENNRIEIYQHEGRSIKFISSVNCLHSLLKSKGIYLFENPLQSTKPTEDLSFYDNPNDVEIVFNQWQEKEQKTFYNPFIFKL